MKNRRDGGLGDTRRAGAAAKAARTIDVASGGEPQTESELRDRAIASLRKKRDFRTHVVVYVVINAFLIGVWAITGAGYFWPGWVLAGWGVGLVANAWDVYGRKPISEADIARETDRLRR
jgi:2TM domain